MWCGKPCVCMSIVQYIFVKRINKQKLKIVVVVSYIYHFINIFVNQDDAVITSWQNIYWTIPQHVAISICNDPKVWRCLVCGTIPQRVGVGVGCWNNPTTCVMISWCIAIWVKVIRTVMHIWHPITDRQSIHSVCPRCCSVLDSSSYGRLRGKGLNWHSFAHTAKSLCL